VNNVWLAFASWGTAFQRILCMSLDKTSNELQCIELKGCEYRVVANWSGDERHRAIWSEWRANVPVRRIRCHSCPPKVHHGECSRTFSDRRLAKYHVAYLHAQVWLGLPRTPRQNLHDVLDISCRQGWAESPCLNCWICDTQRAKFVAFCNEKDTVTNQCTFLILQVPPNSPFPLCELLEETVCVCVCACVRV